MDLAKECGVCNELTMKIDIVLECCNVDTPRALTIYTK